MSFPAEIELRLLDQDGAKVDVWVAEIVEHDGHRPRPRDELFVRRVFGAGEWIPVTVLEVRNASSSVFIDRGGERRARPEVIASRKPESAVRFCAARDCRR